MASTLTDPGSLPEGGSTYVTNTEYKLPDVKVNADDVKGSFATSNLDKRLSLTGDNTIQLSDDSGDSSSQDQPDVPTAAPFKVKPSDIKGLEKKILTELNSQVDNFETFKNLIRDTEGWIFLVQNPGSLEPHMQSVPHGNGSNDPGYSPPQNVPNYTDPDPATTQSIVDSQNAIVRALADTYQLVGDMAAVLNNAAQNYVSADKATFAVGTNVDDAPPDLPPPPSAG